MQIIPRERVKGMIFWEGGRGEEKLAKDRWTGRKVTEKHNWNKVIDGRIGRGEKAKKLRSKKRREEGEIEYKS